MAHLAVSHLHWNRVLDVHSIWVDCSRQASVKRNSVSSWRFFSPLIHSSLDFLVVFCGYRERFRGPHNKVNLTWAGDFSNLSWVSFSWVVHEICEDLLPKVERIQMEELRPIFGSHGGLSESLDGPLIETILQLWPSTSKLSSLSLNSSLLGTVSAWVKEVAHFVNWVSVSNLTPSLLWNWSLSLVLVSSLDKWLHSSVGLVVLLLCFLLRYRFLESSNWVKLAYSVHVKWVYTPKCPFTNSLLMICQK
jgi:hypothetical protein